MYYQSFVLGCGIKDMALQLYLVCRCILYSTGSSEFTCDVETRLQWKEDSEIVCSVFIVVLFD